MTPRQAEVLAVMATGCTRKGAAGALGISQHAIHAHLDRVFRELDVAGLVEAYYQLGWLRPAGGFSGFVTPAGHDERD